MNLAAISAMVQPSGCRAGQMDAIVNRYLDAVRIYTTHVAVPGLDVASDPMPLQQVFVQLQMSEYSALAAAQATANSKGSKGGVGPQAAAQLAPDSSPGPDEALEVLKRGHRLVILGEPGQGKTTVLRQYASTLTSETDGSSIPVIAELGKKRERIEHPGNQLAWLYDRLPEVIDGKLEAGDWPALCEVIKSGRARILLDGFDELTRDGRLQLVQLLDTLPDCQIVLTSRPHAYATAPLRDFSVYQLKELEQAKIEELAAKVCGAIAPKFHCDNVDAALRKVKIIAGGPAKAISRNPLFLSFLCLLVVKKSGEGKLERFPIRPTPLIAACVDALVEWHRSYKPERTWPEELLAPTVTRILAPLALQSFKDATGQITLQSVDQLADEDKTRFLTHLVAAGFVRRRDENYVFPLETFREYFAAMAVASSADPFAEVRAHLHSVEWERVILYACGVPENTRASWLVMAAPTFTGLAKWAMPLLKVMGAIADQAAPGPAMDAGSEALKAALDEMGVPLQMRADAWLATSHRSTEFFVHSILWHRCSYNRLLSRNLRLAVRCLGVSAQCPDRLVKKVVGPLVRAAARHRSWAPPYQVICDTLRSGAANSQVHEVLAGIAASSRTEEHEVAAEVLGIPAHPAPARALTPQLPPMSLTSPGRILAPQFRSTPNLAQALPDGSDPASLKSVGLDPASHLTATSPFPPTPAAQIPSEPAAANVVSANSEPKRLDDREPSAGPTGAPATPPLAVNGDGPHVPAVLPAVPGGFVISPKNAVSWDGAVDPFQHHYIQGTVEQYAGHPVFVPAEPVSDPRQERMEWTLHAANARIPQGRRDLLELTRNPQPGIRLDALKNLRVVLELPEVFECFLNLTNDPWPETRAYAAKALSSMPSDPRVHPRLVEMLSDEEPQVKAAVVTALKDLGTETECRDRMMALTHEPDADVRAQAASALLHVAASPEVRQRLQDLMSDPVSSVRSAALHSLRGWDGPAPRRLIWRIAWRMRRLLAASIVESALVRTSVKLWMELDSRLPDTSEVGEAWMALDVLVQTREQQKSRREA